MGKEEESGADDRHDRVGSLLRCRREKFQDGRTTREKKMIKDKGGEGLARVEGSGTLTFTVIGVRNQRGNKKRRTSGRLRLVFFQAGPRCAEDVLRGGRQMPSSHLKAAQMITEPQGLDDHGCSLPQRALTEGTDFLATH